jgi:dolichol-phosphate mannosyltransferase
MNEEGNIDSIIENLIPILQNYDDYEILFVDDGSTDDSLFVIKKWHTNNFRIKYVSFSKNFGHQNALKAGLDNAKGDCVISMDGDMQHPPELIPLMIDKWTNGKYDIVYTIRQDDPKLGFLKRMSSRMFYKIMNSFSDVGIEAGSADFRLLDKSVVGVIQKLPENQIFFRGLIKWLGFKQISIEYMPQSRVWGTSKYSIKKMYNFAIAGITSFSIKPLQMSAYLGFIFSSVSFAYAFYAIGIKIFTNRAISGWASLLAMVTFIGGIQLMALGVIGTYLGKLFIESKRRPPYIIKEKNND